ncbi:MAG: hypothetical protein ACJA1F_001814 [Paracoccaceae bacterium]|jgi:uncharacterized protein YegL
MNELEQQPFLDVEFAENTEPRCACILLLDTSSSMGGVPISQLNEGLKAFQNEIKEDSLASKRVEVAIVSFGPVTVEQDFVSAIDFNAQSLEAQGTTPMGAAVETAVRMLKERKATYKTNGTHYYRPWVFLITDGAPTDNIQEATALIHAGEADKSLMFFPIGIEGADMNALKQMSVREPLKMKGLMFREFFLWLSASLGSVSQSSPGDLVALTNPTEGPEGWATVG